MRHKHTYHLVLIEINALHYNIFYQYSQVYGKITITADGFDPLTSKSSCLSLVGMLLVVSMTPAYLVDSIIRS